jgi:hypothetical protein
MEMGTAQRASPTSLPRELVRALAMSMPRERFFSDFLKSSGFWNTFAQPSLDPTS